MDDATVEAIQAEVKVEYRYDITAKDVHDLAPIFAKHLPDPRPTEADARGVMGTTPVLEAVWYGLRDLGCFRPEPATEPGAWLAANYRPIIEPVPAAEPPTECDDCYLLTARDAEKRGLLISDAAVMLCPQHVETVTETP